MATDTTTRAPRLKRTLTLWDLILYGVIVIQPVAPMSVFGVLSDRGRGHVVTTILIAMVAMLFTAFSYGRMAGPIPALDPPSPTSARNQSRARLRHGWSMVMDYMLNPMICIIWCSQQANVFAPEIPYWGWALFFGAVFTFLNIQGIKTLRAPQHVARGRHGRRVAVFFMAAAPLHLQQPARWRRFFTVPFMSPAVEFQSRAGGHVDRSAQLHRLRWHLYTL